MQNEKQILQAMNVRQKRILDWYRDLHRIPETAHNEAKTHAYLRSELDSQSWTEYTGPVTINKEGNYGHRLQKSGEYYTGSYRCGIALCYSFQVCVGGSFAIFARGRAVIPHISHSQRYFEKNAIAEKADSRNNYFADFRSG